MWSGKPAVRTNDDNSEGSSHLTRGAAQPCIRLIREDRNHDAVMRIAAGHRHLGSSSAIPCTGLPKWLSWLSLSFCAVAHDAGRRTMPRGVSPVVTSCQRAMSSLRATATIIVLRVLPRPSAVRASNHWARALSFWNLIKRQANWIMPHRTQALPARARPFSRRRLPLSSGEPVRPA